jgi:hypothetical protein
MTSYWAYGVALSPGQLLDWGGTWDGNIPKSDLLPELDHKAYEAIAGLARRGEHNGVKVDWGAWAIRVNAPELHELVVSIYGKPPACGPAAARYIEFAGSMSADQQFALIACEL